MGTKLRVDPGTECKRRVATIKDQLPKDVKAQIFKKYPQYDTASGTRLISNVIAGASSDLKLTEILEAMVPTEKKS